MCFDEAICEAEHNSSDTDTDKSSSNDGNLHIYLEKSEQFCYFDLLYFYIHINIVFVACFVISYYGALWYHH